MVPFDPRADAEALHKAMKGFGTDEKGLIAVLCNRPTAQRVEITKAYKSAFGKVNIPNIPYSETTTDECFLGSRTWNRRLKVKPVAILKICWWRCVSPEPNTWPQRCTTPSVDLEHKRGP